VEGKRKTRPNRLGGRKRTALNTNKRARFLSNQVPVKGKMPADKNGVTRRFEEGIGVGRLWGAPLKKFPSYCLPSRGGHKGEEGV